MLTELLGLQAVCQNILLRFNSRWKHAFQEAVSSQEGSVLFCTDLLLKFQCKEWTVTVRGLKKLRENTAKRLDKILIL